MAVRLWDRLDQMEMRLRAEGYQDLLLYLDSASEQALITYQIADGAPEVEQLETWRGIPVWMISDNAYHGLRAILGERDGYHALGLTKSGEVRRFTYARTNRDSEL